MVFSLEALPARYGDALLLHYGEGPASLIVIDGGPANVFRPSLSKRLQALKTARSPAGPLPIRMVMVSHLDEDHILGLIEWTSQLVTLQQQGREVPHRILTLWHNSFDDIIGNASEAERITAAMGASVQGVSTSGVVPEALRERLSPHGALVLASVNQGRKLRDHARALSLLVNEGFTGLVGAPAAGVKTLDLGGGLSFTVLGPSEQRVAKLQVEWDKKIKTLDLTTKAAQAEAAAFVDDSVFNLSSIVVLATAANRQMLLTGDARGDDILAGLKQAGLLPPGGRFHVDLLKVPHHGSEHNVAREFFEQVTADHYLISSNGERFSNPDVPMLRMLTEARGKSPYTIHFTYPLDEFNSMFDRAGFEALLQADRQAGKTYDVAFREPGAPSIRVDLASPLTD